MPIRKINPQPAPGTVEVQCFFCQKLQTVPLGNLLLGTPMSSDVISFPACTCGGAEVCKRNFDAMPEDRRSGFQDAHRRAANRLSLMLKQQQRVHPDWASQVAGEQTDPLDLVDADKCDLSAMLPPPKQE